MVDAVGHQPAGRGEEAEGIDRGQAVPGGEGDDGVAMRSGEGVRQNQQPAALFAREPRHHRLDLGIVVNRRGPHRHGEGRGRFLDGAQHQTGIGRGRGIVEDRHARDGRGDLRQHPQPFAGHRRVVIAEAGDVAAGARQARDEALADRIGDEREHDRDRACLPPQRLDRRAALGQEHLGAERDQFRRVALEERGVAAGPAPVDAQIAALVPVERAEPLHQGGGARLPLGIVCEIAMSTPRRRIPSRCCACATSGPGASVAAMPARTVRRVVRTM